MYAYCIWQFNSLCSCFFIKSTQLNDLDVFSFFSSQTLFIFWNSAVHKLPQLKNLRNTVFVRLVPVCMMVFHYEPVTSPWPLQVVLVFPGPGAVSVQDMMQCLHHQSDSKSSYTFDEPRIKRLKSEEVQDATHTAENPESGTPDGAKGLESRVFPLQKVVFIDSTWNQTNKISTDERLQGNHEKLHSCSFLKSSDCCWLLRAN